MELKTVIPTRYHRGNAIQALSKARKRVQRDGNFTYVTFVNSKSQTVTGAAKRNPNDDPDIPERGEAIATIRAYKNYLDFGWTE
jgi:hypothetical protein